MAEFVMFHLTTMIKKSQSQRYEIASGINNRQCNCVGYFFSVFWATSLCKLVYGI